MKKQKLSKSALILFLFFACLFFGFLKTIKAQAAITYFNSSSLPADNGAQDGNPVPSITPPSNMVAGDLAIIVAQGRGAYTLAISNNGGQSWTTETAFTNTNVTARIFWCRYDGTWDADPSVSGVANNIAETLTMHVFHPTNSLNTWAVDVAQSAGTFTAPGSPYTVTINGITTQTDGAVALAVWAVPLANTWGAVSGSGWSTPGSAQYRNTTGSDQSIAFAYNIMASKGLTANVSKNESASTAGAKSIIAFKEVNSAPTLSIAQPPSGNTAIAEGSAYNITYTLSDTEDAATVAFYYETDGNGSGGTAVAGCGAEPEETGGTCSFDTSVLATGTPYYIYGVATDGVNSNVTVVSSGTITPNDAPTISVSQPDGTSDIIAENGSFSITYTLTDADTAATVAFYYDSNNADFDGTAITGDCASAGKGTNVTCSWNTTGRSPGNYYIYGIATDGVNSPITSAYSSGAMTINDAPTLAISKPDAGGDTKNVGDLYDITYALGDTDNVVTAAFYYDDTASGLDGTAIAGGCASAGEGSITCSWDTTGVPAGSYYIYGITNDGINNQVSNYSAGQITLVSGTLSVLIVNGSGTEVSSPSVSFSDKNFSWSGQQSSGTLGFASPSIEKVRVTNTTGTPGWTLSLAATSGPSALWSDGSHTYDFNDSSSTGRLQVTPTLATITPQGGCSSSGLNLQSAAYFNSGNSVDIIITSGSEQTGCYWDVTGVGLTQDVPASQDVGSYSINMTLTAT